ncbi:hypothetical protein MRX96_016210 [Rhipicephalus microplus]
MSSGGRFGAGGPRGKRYSWDNPDTVSTEFEWARRCVLAPSGTLVEATGVADGGANWALINGMLTPSSDLTTSIKALVPLVTNDRFTNCVDAKRRLYRQGSN